MASLHALQPGRVLGNRYEILQLLGEGGMGAVYKARDIEVDRFVAVKVIRPDLASRPDILARFKQELILARQVTHKNVIRIFDLGEAEGLKFITMDFIEGRDLKSILREKGKLPTDEVTKIVTQICRALDAAHSEGVVHRDLKPQNIMVDAKGRVTVMDFGIARSMEMQGMTQTGSLVGTPEYMSPEQAKGEDVDARSDLFTLGIIFYELLTGKTPFYADTAYATLLKRTQERARDPMELDPTISPQLSGVVMKCLEMNREQRYGAALDIIHDLGQQTVTGTRTIPPAIAPAAPAVAPAPAKAPGLQKYRLWIIGGAVVVLLAVVLVVFRGSIFSGSAKKAHPAGPTASLLILPFRNASGDPSLDWMGKSLAEMLGTDVGQSEALRTVPPDRLHQILSDLQVTPNSDLDANTVRRIADFTNADHVLSGQYAKYGNQIRIDATVQDLKAQRSTPISATAPSEQGFPHAVDDLAQAVQKSLTLPEEAVAAMKAAAFTPSSASVDALRAYSQGMELSRQGNYLDAVKQFQAATTADPNFALAYSRLAQAYENLGYDKQAQQWSTKAVDLSGNLPPVEKDMIVAASARITKNYDSAIQTYADLLKMMPNDPQVHFEIASVYAAHGALDQAHDQFLQALQIDPKYVDALLAVGRVEIDRGNPQAALGYLNDALTLTVQLGQQQAKASILQMIGTAYRNMNKLDDALQNLQQAYTIEQQIGDKKGMTWSLSQIAEAHNSQGKPDQAEKEYRDVLKLDQQIGDQSGTAFTLLDLGNVVGGQGRYQEAIDLTKQAQQIFVQIGNENMEGLALNNIGTFYLSEGDSNDSLTYLQQALQVRQKLKVSDDIGQTMSGMGDTYRALGQYDKALDSYLHALELLQNAGDKFGVAMTSDGMTSLFEAQGRYGASLKSQEKALKSLQELHQQDVYFATLEANYGNALNLAGQFDQAQKSLDDAFKLARSFKADPLIAQILTFQGERFFYTGDFKSAAPLFQQAAQIASRAKDRDGALRAKFDLAQLSVYDGHAAAAVPALKGLVKDSEALGQKYLTTECSLYLGIALVQARNYAQGQQQIEAALLTAQNAGMKSLLPQANYWLAVSMKAAGDKAGATTHFSQAASLLQEMRQESQSDAISKRADLKVIAEQAGRA